MEALEMAKPEDAGRPVGKKVDLVAALATFDEPSPATTHARRHDQPSVAADSG
jgi:hypothetical protein